MTFKELYFNNNFGIISQIEQEPINYSDEYLETYTRMKEKCDKLSQLRLEFIKEYSSDVESLLDFGSGDGNFLEIASKSLKNTYSYDVFPKEFDHSQTLTRDEVFEKKFDLVTFYDSLEHTKDPFNIISSLKTKFVVISLPHCHIKDKGHSWFMDWKHRKYNEHLHHFDAQSLKDMMNSYGYDLVKKSNYEDQIRTPYDKTLQNILTCMFKKQSE